MRLADVFVRVWCWVMGWCWLCGAYRGDDCQPGCTGRDFRRDRGT